MDVPKYTQGGQTVVTDEKTNESFPDKLTSLNETKTDTEE